MTIGEKIKGLAVAEPHDTYLSNPALSVSKLRSLLTSPRAYKREYIDRRGRTEPTPAMEFGIKAHAALLEPRRFLDNYVIEPELRRNTNDYKAWRSRLPPTAIVLSQKDAERIVSMCESVQEHPIARDLLRGSVTEHSLYFTEPTTGLKCKVRPDVLTEDGYIGDIKTSSVVDRRGFERHVWDMSYHLSVGLYTMGFREVFGQAPKGYVFVVCESTEPHDTCVYVADELLLEKGEQTALEMLSLWKECNASGEWPGLQRGVAENLALPHWVIQQS